MKRREEEGSIYEGEVRVITFRASTFQSVIEKVREMAGSVVARTIFYQIGNEIGHRAFKYSESEITPDNLPSVIAGVLAMRGWGRLASLSRIESPREIVYECTFNECVICHELTAKEPICDVMRGIFAAWLEGYLKKKPQSSVETECRAMNKKSCIFKVIFAK